MNGTTNAATDELTQNGINNPGNDVARVDAIDANGEPVSEDDESVIFADASGHELNEWASTIGIEREELRAACRAIADDKMGTQDAHETFSYADPVVYDARTFDN